MNEINKILSNPTNKIDANKKNIEDSVDNGDFGEFLKKSIDEVNELQKESQKAMADIATGQVKDLHQATLAIDKAEMSMKLMLEVKNKALSAYKELQRTQI